MPQPIANVALPRGKVASVSDPSTGSLLAALGLRETDSATSAQAPAKAWVLAKAKTAIAAAAGKVVNYTITGGVITYSVAPAAAINSVTVAGIIDPGITGALVAGDVFWVQREGEAVALAGSGAVGVLVGTTTTTGSVAPVAIAASTTSIVALDSAIGRVTKAYTAATGKATIRLMNIF